MQSIWYIVSPPEMVDCPLRRQGGSDLGGVEIGDLGGCPGNK